MRGPNFGYTSIYVWNRHLKCNVIFLFLFTKQIFCIFDILRSWRNPVSQPNHYYSVDTPRHICWWSGNIRGESISWYGVNIRITGELWGVYCEDFGENWPGYNSTALHHYGTPHWQLGKRLPVAGWMIWERCAMPVSVYTNVWGKIFTKKKETITTIYVSGNIFSGVGSEAEYIYWRLCNPNTLQRGGECCISYFTFCLI